MKRISLVLSPEWERLCDPAMIPMSSKMVRRFAGIWTHSGVSDVVLSLSQLIRFAARPLISWTP